MFLIQIFVALGMPLMVLFDKLFDVNPHMQTGTKILLSACLGVFTFLFFLTVLILVIIWVSHVQIV